LLIHKIQTQPAAYGKFLSGGSENCAMSCIDTLSRTDSYCFTISKKN